MDSSRGVGMLEGVLDEIRRDRDVLRFFADHPGCSAEFEVLEKALLIQDKGQQPHICLYQGRLRLFDSHTGYVGVLTRIFGKVLNLVGICHPSHVGNTQENLKARLEEVARILKLMKTITRYEEERGVRPNLEVVVAPVLPEIEEISAAQRKRLEELHEWICFFPAIEGEETPGSPLSTHAPKGWEIATRKIAKTVTIVLRALFDRAKDSEERDFLKGYLKSLNAEVFEKHTLEDRLARLEKAKEMLEERFHLSSFKRQ